MTLSSASHFNSTFNVGKKSMRRNLIISALLAAFALTGFASLLPAAQTAQGTSSAVIATKVDFITPTRAHHLKLEQCAVEDCSDTPQ